MSNDGWETLDTEQVIRRQREQHEQTTSGGVGGYEVPLGRPLRRQVPVPPYKPVEKPPKKTDKP